MKKAIGIFLALCMALSLLPAGALAEGDSYTVEIDDKTFDEIKEAIEFGFTKAKKIIVEGTKTNVGETLDIEIPAGTTVEWRATFEGTSTFEGALIALSGGGRFEVERDGTVTANGNSNAISASCDVVIGDGTVESTSAEATAAVINATDLSNVTVESGGTVTAKGKNRAIEASGDVTVDGGTVESTSAKATAAVITTTNVSTNITVQNGGKVTANGNNKAIHTAGNVKIERGTVENTNTAATSSAMVINANNVTVESGGEVIANGNNNAIHTLNGNVVIDGGTVRSTNTEAEAAVIANVSANVTVKNGGKVTANGNGSIAIEAAGNVVVDGGTVENTNTEATAAVITTMNVSTNVTVKNEGKVIANGINYAIYTPNGDVDIDGGVVIAKGDNIAISAVAGYVAVNGGVVIAASTPAISGSPIQINGGVVIVWDKKGENPTYDENTTTDITAQPEGCTAVWGIKGGKSGIYYANGVNKGFAALGGVVVTPKAPPASGGSFAPVIKREPVVYNAPTAANATVWLSGENLSADDRLITTPIAPESNENFNAIIRLADEGDIIGVYDISLQSGQTANDRGMALYFDIGSTYAGQSFTLVHKKADGTLEYFYATADASGRVRFSPIFELSPFMLVKGMLANIPEHEVKEPPKTGDTAYTLPFALLLLAAVCGAVTAVCRKKRARV